MLEGFDAGHPWQPTPLEVGVEAVDRLSQLPANSAAIGDARGGAVRFSWTREVASLRGLRYAGAQEPLPSPAQPDRRRAGTRRRSAT